MKRLDRCSKWCSWVPSTDQMPPLSYQLLLKPGKQRLISSVRHLPSEASRRERATREQSRQHL
ncbi:Conserved hypothetical protein [Prochlorococcus marinus str. MIT 9303]|uniref:Uncharacterized protein n=1 Tax=Prochlorococcus marinus (strain MIT 9303) TaxID=59922 RepID=A2C824_PROM3|nr:Conserved hypothetical protein [Prochlorococcus marinus str. MIT 9303]